MLGPQDAHGHRLNLRRATAIAWWIADFKGETDVAAAQRVHVNAQSPRVASSAAGQGAVEDTLAAHQGDPFGPLDLGLTLDRAVTGTRDEAMWRDTLVRDWRSEPSVAVPADRVKPHLSAAHAAVLNGTLITEPDLPLPHRYRIALEAHQLFMLTHQRPWPDPGDPRQELWSGLFPKLSRIASELGREDVAREADDAWAKAL